MDDCTKVLVYGSFDGFARSTDSSLLISVVLDGGEKVEIPEEFIVSADQMVNKYKIKLKDVIARIEKFDLATKAVWINEILNELGSEYGAFKYKAGYEQGKFDGAMEREKVTVPQFVGDWIERSKQEKRNLRNALNNGGEKMRLWFLDQENYDLFARAWLDGYEIEKEKRYLVKVIGMSKFYECLNFDTTENRWKFFDCDNTKTYRTHHTRKELEQANFGWVFDCPRIEIEEVEE